MAKDLNLIKNISNNLDYLISKKNIKGVNELSRLINCPANTIYNLKNMKNRNPSIETVKKISDFFEISMDDFISENLTLNMHKKKQGIVPLLDFDKIIDKFDLNVSTYEISKNNLSDLAFATRLIHDFYPYKVNDVLFFDKVDYDTINFPAIAIINLETTRKIINLYSVYLYISLLYIGLLSSFHVLIESSN